MRSDPYTLKSRPDIQASEKPLRTQLDIDWCNGVLFNVLAFRNSAVIAEYDAVLWDSDSIMFLEYKDSLGAYKKMYAKRAQQVAGFARNIARSFGFLRYNFTLVVNGIEEPTTKGNVRVIPLGLLAKHQPEFFLTKVELDYVNKLIDKHSEESVNEELKILKNMIEQAGQ